MIIVENKNSKDPRALAAVSISYVIVEGKSFSDDLINPNFKNSQDLSFYREICYGVLRHYYILDYYISVLLDRPLKKKNYKIQALLLVGIYQIEFMRTPDHAAISATVNAAKHLGESWASKLINAVLRNFLRHKKNNTFKKIAEEWVVNYHPKWLFEKLKLDWPDFCEEILEYNNSPPPMTLRVNLKKIKRNEYQKLLDKLNMKNTVDDLTLTGVKLKKPTDIASLPGFEEGYVSIQDSGAQLAANLMGAKKGMRILDACCAPGGKTAHLGELYENSKLLAIDKNELRLKKVYENLSRLNINAKLICSDANDIKNWWDGSTFDRVLIDAPCSGSGIISHHPDIKLLRKKDDIQKFAQQQISLLKSLWVTLAVEGELIYCTCSIFPEETNQIIASFLKSTPTAKILKINANWGIESQYGRQLLPNPNKNGGFFYARLSKTRSE